MGRYFSSIIPSCTYPTITIVVFGTVLFLITSYVVKLSPSISFWILFGSAGIAAAIGGLTCHSPWYPISAILLVSAMLLTVWLVLDYIFGARDSGNVLLLWMGLSYGIYNAISILVVFIFAFMRKLLKLG